MNKYTQAQFDKKVTDFLNEEFLYAKKFADGFVAFEEWYGYSGIPVHARAKEVPAGIYVEIQRKSDRTWREYGMIVD